MRAIIKRSVHRKLLWLSLVAIIAAAVLLYVLFSGGDPIELPEEFLAARQSAALVSEKIVELTGGINEKIKVVNLSDLEGDAAEARALIQEARENNAEAYNQAFDLSRHLQKLAESLGAVPTKSQRLAYEAVAIELSLVGEFITYTQSLNNFLGGLATAVATNSFSDRRAVRDYLGEVNERAKRINELNKEFLSRIEKFDESL